VNFKEYQKKSHATAIYPKVHYEVDEHEINAGASQIDIENAYFVYPAMGLSGEVGELLNKLKKIIRDKMDANSQDFKDSIGKEIGDCLWYIAELATVFDLDLGEIAEQNIEKLAKRKEDDKIKGDGDDR
jgi:NTP pyrophosphatase (non-canonical NTP hydrolase)